MNKKSFILLYVAFFGLFSSSFQQEDPEKFLDYLENEAKTLIFGVGVDGIISSLPPEPREIEFEELSQRAPEEWTFELITENGEVYTFVDESGELDVHGSDGLNVDVSHYFAEWAGVEDTEAGDAFGGWVEKLKDFVYQDAGYEGIDQSLKRY